MICNATITRLDVPSGASGSGDLSYTNGSAVAVRCLVTMPRPWQEVPTPPAMVHKQNAVLTVLRTPWMAALAAPLVGQRVTVQVDGEASASVWRVAEIGGAAKGSIGNWRLTLEGY